MSDRAPVDLTGGGRADGLGVSVGKPWGGPRQRGAHGKFRIVFSTNYIS